MNKLQYKIILLFITIISINIMLVSFCISLFLDQTRSEEIFNYYIKEDILNEPDKLYDTKEKANNKMEEINKENIEENVEENVEEKSLTEKEEYYIKVNYKAQTVTVYAKDEKGYYTVPVKVMICSTGTDTPKEGVYKTTNFKREWLALYGRCLWAILFSNCWKYIVSFCTIF